MDESDIHPMIYANQSNMLPKSEKSKSSWLPDTAVSSTVVVPSEAEPSANAKALPVAVASTSTIRPSEVENELALALEPELDELPFEKLELDDEAPKLPKSNSNESSLSEEEREKRMCKFLTFG